MLQRDYRIEVRIMSEAIFSSGESEPNLVHSKVLSDRYGLVYFHGKSFKGQLKRQAFWLLRQYQGCDERAAEAFLHSIAELYGMNREELDFYCRGMGPTTRNISLHRNGIMKIGNLQLDDQIRALFQELQMKDIEQNYSLLSPHDLIEAQTNIRTGIQLEDGVIRDKMLNTYHTVKQGLIFYSKLHFDADPTPYLPDLQRIVRSFRRMGAGIHRGRGEVKARLLIDGEEGELI